MNTLTPYEAIGGETTVRAITHDFYRIMDELPEAFGIRKLHHDDLSGSEQKLFLFLSGWLGGPNLYIEKFGHPRLRARHLPFSIGIAERDQWLLCMRQSLELNVADELLRERLYTAFSDLADHMRNKEETSL